MGNGARPVPDANGAPVVSTTYHSSMASPHLTASVAILETGDTFILRYYPKKKADKMGDFAILGKAIINGVTFYHTGSASQGKKEPKVEAAVPPSARSLVKPRSNGAVSV